MKKQVLIRNPANKPQNRFSDELIGKIKANLVAWLEEWELSHAEAAALANELFDRALKARIERTSPSAPHVFLSDVDRLDAMVSSAQRIAAELDEKEELMDLLDSLMEAEEPEVELSDTAKANLAGNSIDPADVQAAWAEGNFGNLHSAWTNEILRLATREEAQASYEASMEGHIKVGGRRAYVRP